MQFISLDYLLSLCRGEDQTTHSKKYSKWRNPYTFIIFVVGSVGVDTVLGIMLKSSHSTTVNTAEHR
jgi:hypothetical protein